jgi:PAS domain S-box-containing protein
MKLSTNLKEQLTTEVLIEKQNQLISIVNNAEDVIVSIDKDLRVVEFNSVMAKLVRQGFGIEIKKGDHVLGFIETSRHERLKDIYSKVLKGEKVFDLAEYKVSIGGSLFYESSYSPVFDDDGEVVCITSFSKNVTERVQNEQKLKKAYEEKETLLSEIHHRIKNNLAIISSVLQLQEMNTNNAEAIKCLRDSRMRIKSAALLHEMLYQKDSLDKVSVKKYLSEMFDDINNSIGNKEHKLVLTGEDTSLLIHNAIPAGLLFNEIFTNSIKHGFKNIAQGVIDITIKNKENHTQFEISENGAPFPDEIDVQNSNSTGLMLIKNFTEQLKGTIQLCKTPNTKYILTIDLS